MSNLMELRQAAQYDQEQENANNPLYQLVQGLGTGFNTGIAQRMKEQEDEKRRQANVKQQMSQAQQMMQAMAQMKDNSTSGKVLGTMGNDEQKRRKGVISVSDYIPSIEQGIGDDGMPYFKASIKSATPQEQKAQFEMRKSQGDMEKAQAKSDLLGAYIRGQVQEGAILGEMATLGITADEFDIAAQARERLKSVPQGIPQGFEATEMSRDRMGNLIPSGIKKVQPPTPTAQPTAMDGLREEQARLNIEKTRRELEPQPIMTQEQAQSQSQPVRQGQEEKFRFKKEDSVAERRLAMDQQKFERETSEADRANQAKREAAIDAASTSLSAIDHLLNNINYFGAIEGRMPAGLNAGKREWAKNYDFLESKNVLNVLSEMKSQSRTGATGFGALNEKELGIIQNASMRLDKQLDEKTAAKYLNEMKTAFQKIINREQNGYENEGGVNNTASNVGTQTGTQQKVGRFIVEEL